MKVNNKGSVGLQNPRKVYITWPTCPLGYLWHRRSCVYVCMHTQTYQIQVQTQRTISGNKIKLAFGLTSMYSAIIE